MKAVELSPRLLAIGKQVPEGSKFADIGTDHALLPVWLLQQQKITQAIAADIGQGPLERAKETAYRHQVTTSISFRLGDGLSPINGEEVDVIAIAGMGGETISAILEQTPWMPEWDGLLLLQPMTAVNDLRKWLSSNHFSIEQEQLIEEEKGPYVVMTVRRGETNPLTQVEEWTGRVNKENPDPMRGKYLDQLIARFTNECAGLKKSKNCPVDILEEKETLLAGFLQVKKEWQSWQQ